MEADCGIGVLARSAGCGQRIEAGWLGKVFREWDLEVRMEVVMATRKLLSSQTSHKGQSILCKVRTLCQASKWAGETLTGNWIGVMRFLQTEWHRHERDRNAWEIERQEMKGRIARLEGSTRRSDTNIKSLKKYVNMLEKALKERDAQVKALKTGADLKAKESAQEGKGNDNLAVKHLQRRKF